MKNLLFALLSICFCASGESSEKPGPALADYVPADAAPLLIIGENHTSAAQRLFFRDSLAALKARGYSTLFLEVFPSDLKTDERMRAKLVSSGHAADTVDAFMAIIAEARRVGMAVVGIDKDIPWPWAGEAPSRAEFFRVYVLERNRAMVANIRRAGGNGVLLIGRHHLGLRGDPRQADLVRELGADGGFDFQGSLIKAGLSSYAVTLCGGGESKGEPHVLDLIMRQRGQADRFAAAPAGALVGNFVVKLPN